MYDLRSALAAILAIGIGIALIVAPGMVLRLQFFMHGPTTGRHGEFGEDEIDRKYLHLARLAGLLPLGIGLYLVAVPWL